MGGRIFFTLPLMRRSHETVDEKKTMIVMYCFGFYVCVPHLYYEGASPMMTEPDLVDLVGGLSQPCESLYTPCVHAWKCVRFESKH